MPEIAKCPCCGRVLEELFNINYNPDYYECPDVLCAFVCSAKDLPRMTAAMSFSRAAAWQQECEDLLEWLDEKDAPEGVVQSAVVLEKWASEHVYAAFWHVCKVFA